MFVTKPTEIISKLVIDSKWKWVAQDKRGSWFLFQNRPYIATKLDQWIAKGGYESTLFGLDYQGPWEESLHEIKDSTFHLVQVINVPKKDEKVIVSLHNSVTTGVKRYSTGKVTEDGQLLCYKDGHTSWIATNTTSWPYWRKPTEEESKPPV